MKNLREEPTDGEEDNHEFDLLQARMLGATLRDTRELELCRLLCLAANEAAAIAWQTSYPLLAFPCLFEEKADEVRRYFLKQREMRAASGARAVPPHRRHLGSLCPLHPGLEAARRLLARFQPVSASSAA